jgi:uncharacterized protein (UPF0332 family)
VNEEALDLWQRSLRSLKTAESLVDEDPDAAASRAYYAAFYAVSAIFAIEGKTFGKHSALKAALHRDLVKSGKATAETGAAYSWLADLRTTGDYGGSLHVGAPQARDAVRKAHAVLDAMRQLSPEPFPEVGN